MTKKREGKPPEASEMDEAEIDRNLQETFPASDPPSWTLGTDHHKHTTQSHESEAAPNDSPEE